MLFFIFISDVGLMMVKFANSKIKKINSIKFLSKIIYYGLRKKKKKKFNDHNE